MTELAPSEYIDYYVAFSLKNQARKGSFVNESVDMSNLTVSKPVNERL